ncbi:MAG: PGPGW domain-containing protein [Opitutaceae bacterium]
MLEWFEAYDYWFALLGLLSLLLFVGSLILVPVIILELPVDFFTRRHQNIGKLSLTRLCLRAAKNIAGALFIFSGILMLVLPGQGVLSLLIGLSLIDFPAKRRLQVRFIRMHHVQKTVNWIRHKGKRKPIEIPPAWEA